MGVTRSGGCAVKGGEAGDSAVQCYTLWCRKTADDPMRYRAWTAGD